MHSSSPLLQEAGTCTWTAFHSAHRCNNAAPPWLVTLLTAVDHVQTMHSCTTADSGSCLQGKEHVPDTVDHVQVPINPQEDRSWLQSEPKAITDNVHTFDTIGPQLDMPENWSEAVKRLKQRVLQRVIDTYKMEQCLIFCRWVMCWSCPTVPVATLCKQVRP